MYMPIWIIYWFPFLLFINYIIKLTFLSVVLLIWGKVTKESAIYNAGNIIKSMFFAIGAEIIGVAIFCALEINMESDFYYRLHTIFSSSIFFVVIIISFLLNYRFIIKKAKISARQKVVVGILVAIATAPYLFLLPPSPLVY